MKQLNGRAERKDRYDNVAYISIKLFNCPVTSLLQYRSFAKLCYMSEDAPIIPVIVSKEGSSRMAGSLLLRRAAYCVSYIPPLFFISLWCLERHDEGVFHGKQALVLTLFAVVVNVLGPTIVFLVPLLGAVFVLIANIMLFVFMILGMYRGAAGVSKALPIIGGFASRFTF